MNFEEIFETIRKRRKTLNIDQHELARLSGVSVHTLINLETGKSSPTVRTLLAVCDTLGLNVNLSLHRNQGE